MNRQLATVALFVLCGALSASLRAQTDSPPVFPPSLKQLARFEPTGLSLLQPYVRGKIPVVFVHGLWSSPWSWERMVEALEADPAIKGRFQLWTFGYSTDDPFPYSAYLLRKNLNDVRTQIDPQKTDPSFDQMVLVGHSMGGLVSKMIVVDSGDRLWHLLSERPILSSEVMSVT